MADIKISGLPAASSVATTDEIELNQGGTSRKATAQQVADGGHPAWVTPSFSAGNFTANNSMTWTVGSGDVATYAYTIQGKTMTVAFGLNTTSVGGTPSTELRIAIPAGKTATKVIVNAVMALDNGAIVNDAYAITPAGGTYIAIGKYTGANWSAATDSTYIGGQITFEIN